VALLESKKKKASAQILNQGIEMRERQAKNKWERQKVMLVREKEEDLTFKPNLNETSVKIIQNSSKVNQTQAVPDSFLIGDKSPSRTGKTSFMARVDHFEEKKTQKLA
jgi:hypothetical protein